MAGYLRHVYLDPRSHYKIHCWKNQSRHLHLPHIDLQAQLKETARLAKVGACCCEEGGLLLTKDQNLAIRQKSLFVVCGCVVDQAWSTAGY